MVDKKYCSSSYLMYRTIADRSKCFTEKYKPRLFQDNTSKAPVKNASDLLQELKNQVENCTKDGKAALALSGGIDSAILAKFMPKGAKAYTFQCIVPGIEVMNEVPEAKKFAEENGLEHEVIEVYWEDFENYAPLLMKHKGAPIHSIEVQIYKAALKAKADGYERVIFGESSDVNYGGFSGLTSKDWTVGEFIDRYSYVAPYHALKDFELPVEPITRYEKDGYVDVHEFCRHVFLCEAMGTYTNACESAGITLETPYLHTWLSVPLDYDRIRSGETKYIVREAFEKLYPEWEIPMKIPMPRPMNEWLADWKGPVRDEFWRHCTDNMTGDQKWLVWALEKFFDLIES